MEQAKYIKGLLEPLVLKLLHEGGRMYGYEITQKIKQLTAGELTITEGALYPLLHRLEADGVIEAEQEMADNRLRKYYRLTRKGKKQTQTAIESLHNFSNVLLLLLQPQKS
ncbi:MAG: PadR family transcriptional regulator [Lacibacter sp.]|jgi:DNA-binding PadR family transcriptional regulator